MRDDDRREGPYTGPTIPMRRPEPEPTHRLPRPPQRRARPRRPAGPILRALALGLLGLLGLALLLGYLQVRDLGAATIVREPRPGLRAISPAAPFTMLLIGVDERPDHPEEGVRGDTLIVARVDPGGGWVALLSIPRDTLAEVPDLGAAKINAAYSHGYIAAEALYGPGVTPREAGMALAAESVERLIGTPIDYTAQVNFDGFAGVVDALGGITVDVPRAIVDDEYPTEDFGVMRVEFAPGPQRMDGARALIYARTRHADSDFGRAERQQQVLRAIVDELRARGPLGQALLLPRLRQAVGATVATTLPFDRPDALAALASLAARLSPDQLLRLQLAPDTVAVREEGSALIWDAGGLRAQVERLLSGPSIEAEAARVQVLNGTGVAGLAGSVSRELAGQGLTLLPAADAAAQGAPRTVVYDAGGAPLTARHVAELLRAELRDGAPPGEASAADVVVVLGADAQR